VDDNGDPLSAAQLIQANSVPVSPRWLPAGDPVIQTTCYLYWRSELNGRTERVGRLIGTVYAGPRLEQRTSSAHSLGVGIKSGSGGWFQSGRETKKRAGTGDTGVYRAAAGWMNNKVNYRYQEEWCSWSGKLNLVHTYLRPRSFHSFSTSIDFISTVPAWNKLANCSDYVGDGVARWFKNTQRNITNSTGVSLGVVRVSSQAGWDIYTQIWWRIDKGRKQWYCGSTNADFHAAFSALC
jgi:hypothetical protein